jgi:hypothetical protein
MQNSLRHLLDWSAEQSAAFRRRAVVARHRLHESSLFSDEGLTSILDRHPREQLQAFTMGADPLKIQEWKPVDIGKASGKDLLCAIHRGRLWLHIFRMQKFHPDYAALQTQLFSELAECCPDLKPFNVSSTLILSSPAALVYYHADAQFNLLWHIRGTKQVWSYPENDPELIEQDVMEDIFASYADEEVPYRPEFDEKASVFKLGPGDVISWALNAPHRVTNLTGLNVSLSTVYETEQSYRRKLVYCANRFFRRSFGLPARSTRETGGLSYAKRTAFKFCRKAGLVETPPSRAYITDLIIDPEAPEGVRRRPEGLALTQFSKKEFTLVRGSSGDVAAVRKV